MTVRVQDVKQLWTFFAPSRPQHAQSPQPEQASQPLDRAVAELALDAATTARLDAAFARARSKERDLLDRLQAVVAEAARFQPQYSELALTKVEILAEEKRWLADLIRRALDEALGDWAALYLAMNHQELLCRRIDHRLNPRSHVRMPSAFVYAMH